MKRKKAIITVELVDESVFESNGKIAQELHDWFNDVAVSVPWVREVKEIIVKDG